MISSGSLAPTPGAWRSCWANQQKTGQRTKASAIVEAAANLVGVGVSWADDVRAENSDPQRAWTRVCGLGPVTWKYFTMPL